MPLPPPPPFAKAPPPPPIDPDPPPEEVDHRFYSETSWQHAKANGVKSAIDEADDIRIGRAMSSASEVAPIQPWDMLCCGLPEGNVAIVGAIAAEHAE